MSVHIFRANLGRPSNWFMENSQSATFDLSADLAFREIPISRTINYLSAAVSNNPDIAAVIIGFDYFGDDLLNLVWRCLYTGITVKLCDQSNKQTGQYAPLHYFARGSQDYSAWPTVNYPNTPAAKLRNELYAWKDQNQEFYRLSRIPQALRELHQLFSRTLSDLEHNPQVQVALNEVAAAYFRTRDQRYLNDFYLIGSDESYDFLFEVYEIKHPLQPRLTDEEIFLGKIQVLGYLAYGIAPSRPVEKVIRYRQPSWTGIRFHSVGEVVPHWEGRCSVQV